METENHIYSRNYLRERKKERSSSKYSNLIKSLILVDYLNPSSVTIKAFNHLSFTRDNQSEGQVRELSTKKLEYK